jgi:hypothetical protein
LPDPQYAEDRNQERNDDADTAPSEDADPPNPRCFGQTRCRNCPPLSIVVAVHHLRYPHKFIFYNSGSSHARALSWRAPLGCGSARAWRCGRSSLGIDLLPKLVALMDDTDSAFECPRDRRYGAGLACRRRGHSTTIAAPCTALRKTKLQRSTIGRLPANI